MAASENNSSASFTYHGSCHCRKITYAAGFDFSSDPPPAMTKCNCTVCHKGGLLQITPLAGSFKLITPGGLSELCDYTFHHNKIHHYFCSTCGVRPFLTGSYVADGKTIDFTIVNALTLDMRRELDSGMQQQEYSSFDLRKIKTKYQDGRKENFVDMKDTPCEGGVW